MPLARRSLLLCDMVVFVNDFGNVRRANLWLSPKSHPQYRRRYIEVPLRADLFRTTALYDLLGVRPRVGMTAETPLHSKS